MGWPSAGDFLQRDCPNAVGSQPPFVADSPATDSRQRRAAMKKRLQGWRGGCRGKEEWLELMRQVGFEQVRAQVEQAFIAIAQGPAFLGVRREPLPIEMARSTDDAKYPSLMQLSV